METQLEDRQTEIKRFRESDNRRFAQRTVDATAVILANIAPGKEYTAEELAKLLNAAPNSVQFGLAVSEVNKALYRHGYVLTSRGFNQTRWKILEPKRNRAHAQNKCRQHINGIKECAILAHATASQHADKLDPAEVRKLEKAAEIMALRYIIANRIR